MEEMITFSKNELKQLIKSEIESYNPPKQNQHMKGKYSRAKKKYTEILKERLKPFHAYRIAEAIRDICKHNNELNYINKATDEQVELMGELYERMAKCYLEWLNERG